MLSGEYGSVAISDITIHRGERIRKEIKPEALEALQESLSRIGQLHPVVLTRDFVLVAGETRLTAATNLGWSHIQYQFSDTLEEDELLGIELEENIKRSDLTWQENCDAVKKYHDLQCRIHEDWTADQTAAAIGLSPSTVSSYLGVAREIAKGNTRVSTAIKLSTAAAIVSREKDRRKADILSEIGHAGPAVQLPPAKLGTGAPIEIADFNTWAPAYTGPPFNFLHCDFPYGISADTFDQSAGAESGSYKDTYDTFTTLVQTLTDNKERLLGKSAHILFWFSIRYYQRVLDLLQPHFWVDTYPLIWVKSDNRGTLPDPSRGPRRVYETAFLCSFGDRKIISAVSNVYAAPTSKVAGHMSEKNPEMLQHFMRMCVNETTRMLDPTCGSGGALRAAKALGAKTVLGLEINEEYAENAKRAWVGVK